MWTTIVAILGTLAGAGLSGWLTQRAARAERVEQRDEHAREQRRESLRDLAVALSDHRAAMQHAEHARLTGADAGRVQELRDAYHATRSAITAPHVAARILIPGLADRIEAAVHATYAMRQAADLADLETRRTAAFDALDGLIAGANI